MTPSLEGVITAEPCPICHERAAHPGICDECGGAVPQPKERKFAAYQAQTIDHYHQRTSGNANPGPRAVARKKLCLDCYRVDFHKKYPNEPLPL
jgi:hypothetical protein